jgi:hypothetical protein
MGPNGIQTIAKSTQATAFCTYGVLLLPGRSKFHLLPFYFNSSKDNIITPKHTTIQFLSYLSNSRQPSLSYLFIV